MPNYPFVDESGNPHEVNFPMKDAPPIGSTIRHEGMTLTRVASTCGLEAAITACSRYPYTSMRHGAFMEGAKHDSQGRAIIESRRHEKQFMAIHDLARD